MHTYWVHENMSLFAVTVPNLSDGGLKPQALFTHE